MLSGHSLLMSWCRDKAPLLPGVSSCVPGQRAHKRAEAGASLYPSAGHSTLPVEAGESGVQNPILRSGLRTWLNSLLAV